MKKKDNIKTEKNTKRELEYLIWVIEEKLRRTTDPEIIKLLNDQLTIWKSRL